MYARILALALVLALGTALVGCATQDTADPDDTPETSAPGDATDGSDDAAGDSGELRLANGIYDQADGSVMVLGTLEWVDLEGGFYAVTGAPGDGGTVAVVANADEFADELEDLTGSTVFITGTRSEGASIRMAGPEVVVDSIEKIDDTPGAAE
jgi:hypothetical protein